MRKLFNEEQIKFIVENYQTMKYKDIANHLGDYKSEQIAGWLSNNGYKNKNRSIYTKYEQEFMRNNYKNMLYKDIAKKINKTERQVRGWINTYCERKNRIFNENYFEKIDNPNNSYWLGFIYADGWVCCNYDTYNYELGIELQKSDRYHLEKFNKELGSVHKIVDEHHEKIIANNPKISITDSSVLRIYSKKIVEDLIKHNVVLNKTLNPIFPKLNDYFYDFLRGYIDGDGCIYVNSNTKYYQVHITSAMPQIFEYIQKRVYDEHKIVSHIYKERDKKYRICFNGSYGKQLLDLIYYDENGQKLDRKYKKYLEIKRLSY